MVLGSRGDVGYDSTKEEFITGETNCKGTREGPAGVWSATVDAGLHGRRNHTPR